MAQRKLSDATAALNAVTENNIPPSAAEQSETQKKSNPFSKLLLNGVLLLSLFAVCFLFFNVFSQKDRLIAQRQTKYDNLASEYSQQETISKELDKEAENYQTDHYLEQMARKLCGLVYKDEMIFIISE